MTTRRCDNCINWGEFIVHGANGLDEYTGCGVRKVRENDRNGIIVCSKYDMDVEKYVDTLEAENKELKDTIFEIEDRLSKLDKKSEEVTWATVKNIERLTEQRNKFRKALKEIATSKETESDYWSRETAQEALGGE